MKIVVEAKLTRSEGDHNCMTNTPKLKTSDFTEKMPSIAYSGDMYPLHAIKLTTQRIRKWTVSVGYPHNSLTRDFLVPNTHIFHRRAARAEKPKLIESTS
ncbi:hypothetical protein IEQ34_001374 [Dendrobium chrysotoxum]|uniref:Uncharacterized protein n=1 Tax=Dendrobium chrysotoxum TaxID=161865 RepID=A0AAV7HL22_DENCH|nr:hypothetical protein IEQ34_001374 [Dendrobium chrysotoxum]